MKWFWFGFGLVQAIPLWFLARQYDRLQAKREEFWKVFAERYHLDPPKGRKT